MPYVTAAGILAQAGVTAPTAADTAWATTCAAAIEGALTTMLNGATLTASGTAELNRAALMDGVGAYVDRDAPHGILSLGPDGEAVRLGADVLRASWPVVRRYTLPGIG